MDQLPGQEFQPFDQCTAVVAESSPAEIRPVYPLPLKRREAANCCTSSGTHFLRVGRSSGSVGCAVIVIFLPINLAIG